MLIQPEEILETIQMIENERLDIRTVTIGINLRDCASRDISDVARRIYDKVTSVGEGLVAAAEHVQAKYGIPIVNKRISVTPISNLFEPVADSDPVELALSLDRAAADIGVDFIGGYSALVQKGITPAEHKFILSIPDALSQTERVCSSVNVASTKAGINMDAIILMSNVIRESAKKTASRDGIACAKIVVFANIPEDNPFMAGAYHGHGEGEAVVNVGISGPGVVRSVVERHPEADLRQLSEIIKKTVFKITRLGELVAKETAACLSIAPGIIDLSLAPTPQPGDSVAQILEAMGLEGCGAHGTTAALAMLNDAVKKGGAMGTSMTGGLSGAFIPVSEDEGMIRAAAEGLLTIDKLEAMTAVCSVGLDMIVIAGDVDESIIAAIIADEMAIGVVNNKTTAVRLIPAPGKKVGDWVNFGGLLGRAPVMPVKNASPRIFIKRGGQVPPPLNSLSN